MGTYPPLATRIRLQTISQARPQKSSTDLDPISDAIFRKIMCSEAGNSGIRIKHVDSIPNESDTVLCPLLDTPPAPPLPAGTPQPFYMAGVPAQHISELQA